LPLSPPPAAKAEAGPLELPSLAPARPASPAFSTTSTAEGASSPLLPPVPAPTFSGRTLDHLNTTPPSIARTHRSNSSSHSQYYTASWGSPYQHPVGTSHRTRSQRHSHTLSGSERSEDSSIRHLEFHTPYLRPAPSFTRTHTLPDFVSQDGLISAAVLANRARRPARGLTEDWIRQHTGGELAERNNWLSDDAGDSEHSSLSGSISGEGENWLAQDSDTDPRTPTLKRFLEIREEQRLANSAHRRHISTETLTQADFSDLGLPSMSGEMGNAAFAEELATPTEERPAPPAKDSVWPPRAIPSFGFDLAPDTALPSSPAPAPLRLKKKVPWKGKSILVLLPRDDGLGVSGKAPVPMQPKDVESMLKNWERSGYDTKGFDLGQDNDYEGDLGAQGQSRGIWPVATDVAEELEQRDFQISIPDRKGERLRFHLQQFTLRLLKYRLIFSLHRFSDNAGLTFQVSHWNR
jgi:hypothetical protein